MKDLAIFLSLYILLLSAMPCADVDTHGSLPRSELSAASPASQHSDSDCCSPFCTCRCCQGTFSHSSPIGLAVAEATPVSWHTFIPDFRSVDLFDFRVPPKA